MSSPARKITDTAKDLANSVNEIAQDRVFSPMYFYFIISWVIINWKFVYTLLFVDEQTVVENIGVLKLGYLVSLYDWSWYEGFALSIGKLIVFPFISAFAFVWWVTIASEVFHKRYEQHQSNKRKIKREIEYREKVQDTKLQREAREEEYDLEMKRDVKYEDNPDFNNSLDENMPFIEYTNTNLAPSEALYKTDYEAYKAQLKDWEEYQEAQVEAYLENQADIARGK